ncbi:MAG: tyrosine-type recombinase/integrase [Silvibacterium sp.]
MAAVTATKKMIAAAVMGNCSAVKQYAKRIGIDHLAPHDLRRTCARLCHHAGGELEQIQFLLSHASVQTTERYIGCQQKLKEAVNDRFRILLAETAR